MKLPTGSASFNQPVHSSPKLQPLTQEAKIYFITKVLLFIIIILERLFLMLDDSDSDRTMVYFLLIIATFCCSLIFEWIFTRIVARKRIREDLQQFIIWLLHIGTFQILIECSLGMSSPTSEQLDVLRHDILFLTTLTVVFVESVIFKVTVFLYVILIFFYRLSAVYHPVYYVTWAFMSVIILLSSALLRLNDFYMRGALPQQFQEDLEDYTQGIAIINKEGRILLMNRNFKAIIGTQEPVEAFETILRLRKFDSYSERVRRGFMEELRNDKPTSQPLFRSKVSIRPGALNRQMSINTNRKSLDIEKASAVTFKESVNIGEEMVRDPLDRSSYPGQSPEETGGNQRVRSYLFSRGGKSKQSMASKSAMSKTEIDNGLIPHEESVKAIIQNLLRDLGSGNSNKATWGWQESAKRWIATIMAPEPQVKRNTENELKPPGPTVHKIRVPCRNGSGELRVLEIRLLVFSNKYHDGIFIHLSDATCDVKLQEALELVEQKERLLRFVAHEFRNPLNVAVSALEMLKNKISVNLCSYFLEPALNSSKILLSLVNDLLDFAQIKAKKLRISIQPTNVKRIIEELLDMVKLQAETRDIELKLEWDHTIRKKFMTDPLRVKQILLNLITNAFKFTPAKGSITIKGTSIDYSVICIEVIDTGAGMTPQELEQLFGEFGRIQRSSHLNPRGIGLGLVISKLLSQQLGPDDLGLKVQSEVGKGTNFSFRLASKSDGTNKASITTKTGELDVSDDESRYTPDELLEKLNEYGVIDQATKPPRRLKTDPEKDTQDHITHRLKAVEWKENFKRQDTKRPVHINAIVKSTTVPSLSNIQIEPIKFAALSQGSNVPSKLTKRAITHMNRKVLAFGRSSSVNDRREENSDNKLSLKFSNLVYNLNIRCECSKVLLVDDDSFNLTVLSLLLKSLDLECVKAVGGERAIQEVIKNQDHHSQCQNFSIIFMDVEMPMMNGFETTKLLRKKMLEGEISFIPIIGVTGHNAKDKKVECLVSGMNDIVTKPITPQIVQMLLLKWVEDVEEF